MLNALGLSVNIDLNFEPRNYNIDYDILRPATWRTS